VFEAASPCRNIFSWHCMLRESLITPTQPPDGLCSLRFVAPEMSTTGNVVSRQRCRQAYKKSRSLAISAMCSADKTALTRSDCGAV
jgi:hypothetical protein